MKLLKNNSGISMIMLVIAIIMMALIVTFAVFSSRNTTTEATFASSYRNLSTVKEACDDAELLIEINPNEYNEYYFFGTPIPESERSDIKSKCGLTSEEEFGERTYIIKPASNNEERRILENLELKNISDTYVVDLTNKKYYLLNGVKAETSGEKILYEYRDMLTAYELLIK